MSLTSSFSLNFRSTYTSTDGMASLSAAINKSFQASFANGVAEGQCDLVWHKANQSLADGASVVYDLSTLEDAFGNSISFAKIKAVIIENLSNMQILTVGNAAANPWAPFTDAVTNVLKVPTGSLLTINNVIEGYPVSGTSKNIMLENGTAGDAALHNIWVIGTSA